MSTWCLRHINTEFATEFLDTQEYFCDACLPSECHKARDAILAAGSGLTHAQIQEIAAEWYAEPYRRISMTEFGLPWTSTRKLTRSKFEYETNSNMFADVLGFDTYRDRYHIIECKTSRSDFLRGQKKFNAYRQWCDCFYVAAPAGIVEKGDLPSGVGLLTIRHDGIKPWAVLIRPARSNHNPSLSHTLAGARLRLRIMTWLISYYEGHRRQCEENVPLPLNGVWAPAQHFDIEWIHRTVAEAQREATT